MRASALMNLPITYIFTHDSVAIGQDGSTHEPIEQLVSLRSIPNMITFRPCDFNEVLGCWEYITKTKKPINLVISKSNMPKIASSNAKLVSAGAYIIGKEEQKLDGIIIATGTEVEMAMQLKEHLKNENIDIRVVSMPSQELFLKTDKAYQNSVLPKNIRTIVIEAGSKLSWGLFVHDEKYIIGINDFGYSGKPEEVIKKCGFDYETIRMKVARLILNN